MASKKIKIVDIDAMFESNIDELNKEIEECRQLYTELKTHYDEVKFAKQQTTTKDMNISFDGMASSSTQPHRQLAFIHQQSSNLKVLER